MPNLNDGAQTKLPRSNASDEGHACRWSKCENHATDIDGSYKSGNIAREGQALRSNLEAESQQPWRIYANVREMYVVGGNRLIKKKTRSYPYRVEAHHLIPVEVVSKTSTLKNQNLKLCGWDINDVSNGIFLPKDALDVALHLLQQHNGSHPATYTDPITVLLKEIELSYKRACQGAEDVSHQLSLNDTMKLASQRVRAKILAIRLPCTEFWGVHTNSKQVYEMAIGTWEARRAQYCAQQLKSI